ncbi:MAG TPA: Bax inhibitor-1/YccA family protein [Thermoanaerobaculia bacterium]|nr:Bax inhibitor-1/YccA family protein [Thermoanaerobaculia bacterium]
MTQFPYRSGEPAWISSSTADVEMRERSFIRSVYGWMFAGLMLTAFAALAVVLSPALQRTVLANRMIWWILVIAEFGLVIYLSARITRMSFASAAVSFLLYSFLNGLTLSVIFFAYTSGSIAQAFVTAGGMFAAMSVYGMVTKRDLTSWGSFFFMGLIGIVLCSIINMFLHSGGLAFAISLIGVFVFLGLTAWDTQKLKLMARAGGGVSHNLAVIGALSLYLDFINLFLFLLRLFGRRD